MASNARWKPSVTVAAVIEQQGRYLLVEEHTADGLRLNDRPATSTPASRCCKPSGARCSKQPPVPSRPAIWSVSTWPACNAAVRTSPACAWPSPAASASPIRAARWTPPSCARQPHHAQPGLVPARTTMSFQPLCCCAMKAANFSGGPPRQLRCGRRQCEAVVDPGHAPRSHREHLGPLAGFDVGRGAFEQHGALCR